MRDIPSLAILGPQKISTGRTGASGGKRCARRHSGLWLIPVDTGADCRLRARHLVLVHCIKVSSLPVGRRRLRSPQIVTRSSLRDFGRASLHDLVTWILLRVGGPWSRHDEVHDPGRSL